MGVRRRTQCYRHVIDRTGQGLYTFHVDFKRYHVDVSDALDDDDQIEKEGYVMEEHEDKMAHITIILNCSSFPTTSFETKTPIKTKTKELEFLRRCLAYIS